LSVRRDQSFSSNRDDADHGTMSFGDHLDELRRRLLLSLVVPLPLSIIAFFFSNTLIHLLVLPLEHVLAANHLPRQLQVISIPEVVVTQLKLSVVAAVVLAAPWILWQLWKFVSPGLYQHERRFVRFLIPGSAVLTMCGVALMYFVMLPLMLRVMVLMASSLHASGGGSIDPRVEAMVVQDSLSITLRHHAPQSPQPGQAWVLWPDMTMFVAVPGAAPNAVEVLEVPKSNQPLLSQLYRLSDYIGFVLLLFLGIVLAFQMPLVVLLLGWVGLASAEWLRKKRRYALFICAIVAIVITPPDVVSMLIMLGPLYGLYELGIVLLVIAPARKVAEGRVLSIGRRGDNASAASDVRERRFATDNSSSQTSQTHRSAQTDDNGASGTSATQSRSANVDGDKDGPP